MRESKKYFKIQVESPKVNGVPILVDFNKSARERVEDLIDAYRIEYVGGRKPHYLFFEKSYDVPRETISSSPQASIADTVKSVKIGRDSKEPLLKAILNKNKNLEITEHKKRIFFTAIDKEKADEMVESSKNWKMLQAWV